LKKILGISAFYHDSAACITVGNEIVAAAQEERFTRKKHTAVFPKNAISYCLAEAGLNIDDLDAIVFYDKPLLKFERLLETYYAFSPRGLISFLKAVPIWLKEKLFLKRKLLKGLKKVEKFNKKKLKILYPEHHLSHAASTFYTSPYEESAILCIDGVGEWCTASIGYGKGKDIEFIKELHFPHSIGLLYSAATYYLGFTVNSGEYKVMGLAPYGNPNSERTQQYVKLLKESIIDIKQDGSVWLNQKCFSYATGLRMTKDKKWEKLLGLKRRKNESELTQEHCDFALAIQLLTEEVILKMAKEAKKITGSKNICLAGGVALNCVANGKLLEEKIFEYIYVQPASGDAGGALGACLAAKYIYFENKRIIGKDERMKGAYLGPEFSNQEVLKMNLKLGADSNYYESFELLCEEVAQLIAQGNVMGWFQGRMEFGPRALGNRSILGDSKNPEMQKKINLKIKYRESFRPFAPSVLEEDAQNYFELESSSPYMLFVAPVKEAIRKPLPNNFYELPLMERLNLERSELQSITHLDFSARIQTVEKQDNPRFHQLLSAMKERTGDGILLNTSFNVRGEPIVCTPADAFYCFMNTEMDYLVINNHLYKKTEQKDWNNKKKWKQVFDLD
jgi:carbamoyltransferase